MKYTLRNKKGIGIPILLVVTLCFGGYIVSLAWSMSSSRSRFQQTLNNRKAYYIARAGVEHMRLKLKTMHQYCSDCINALEKAPQEEKDLLNKAFREDIILPSDVENQNSLYSYKVTEFGSDGLEAGSDELAFQLEVEGRYSGYKSSVKRLIQISR